MFHITVDMKTGVCRAKTPQSCPYVKRGECVGHYGTQREAEEALASMLSNRVAGAPRGKQGHRRHRKRRMMQMVSVAGVVATAVSVAGCDSGVSLDGALSPSVSTSHYDGYGMGGGDSSSQGDDSDVSRDSGGADVRFQGKSLTPTASEVDTAKNELARLTVQSRNTSIHYSRASQFGPFRHGVVGRMEHRDITHGQFRSASPTSRAVGGWFIDPYTGTRVQIIKGSKTDTDVDHIVPLKAVAQSQVAGHELTEEQRHAIANDPDNLQITSSKANRSKGDDTADTYLPSYQQGQCRYVLATITVKTKYDLSVSAPEKAALSHVLDTKCHE